MYPRHIELVSGRRHMPLAHNGGIILYGSYTAGHYCGAHDNDEGSGGSMYINEDWCCGGEMD